jgi:hypothetical protein
MPGAGGPTESGECRDAPRWRSVRRARSRACPGAAGGRTERPEIFERLRAARSLARGMQATVRCARRCGSAAPASCRSRAAHASGRGCRANRPAPRRRARCRCRTARQSPGWPLQIWSEVGEHLLARNTFRQPAATPHEAVSAGGARAQEESPHEGSRVDGRGGLRAVRSDARRAPEPLLPQLAQRHHRPDVAV